MPHNRQKKIAVSRAVRPTIIEPQAIDLFLQKKGAFYLNQALWTEEPMVHYVNNNPELVRDTHASNSGLCFSCGPCFTWQMTH